MAKEKKVWHLIHYSKKVGHVEVQHFDDIEKNIVKDIIKEYFIQDTHCFICLIKGEEYEVKANINININKEN